VFLLDDKGNEAELGAPGEVLIAGVGLARGYLHDPEETQRRFIENPLGSGRAFRTGDVAVVRVGLPYEEDGHLS
jgi:non-ribosomal peptide synthetase component F